MLLSGLLSVQNIENETLSLLVPETRRCMLQHDLIWEQMKQTT